MSDRRVFESLCLEPNRAGYSYDNELLVDVDRAYDFDEAVIRLITKCNSIVTQFHTLGHHFSEFSVAFAKVQGTTGSPTAASNGKNRPEPAMRQKMASTADSRNLKFMDAEWRRLKRKNYNGMVAVSRISRSSIPRNGAGGKYSVKEYTETLLGHIQGYFMFKSYCPAFERWMAGENEPQGKEKVLVNESADDEYLVYLVYRLHLPHLPQRPKTPTRPRWTELEKLDLHWPFGQKRRHTSGESSVSSCSSSSSTPSGGPTYLTPPSKPAPHEEARRRSSRIKTPDPISPDWEVASAPPGLASPTFSTDEEADPFHKTPKRVSSNRRRQSSTQNSSSPYVEADLFHKTPQRISSSDRRLSSSSSTSSTQSERTRSSPRLRNKTGE